VRFVSQISEILFKIDWNIATCFCEPRCHSLTAGWLYRLQWGGLQLTTLEQFGAIPHSTLIIYQDGVWLQNGGQLAVSIV